MAWQSSPADQNADDAKLRIRGVREGDVLPPMTLGPTPWDGFASYQRRHWTSRRQKRG